MSTTIQSEVRDDESAARVRIESITELDNPWQDEELLRELYVEDERSVRDIASLLGCHHSTVHNWLCRFDIPTREAVAPEKTWFEPNDRLSFWINPAGYMYAISTHNGVREMVGIHVLVAIAGGADPHRAFADETHCHHLLHKLDTPKTVVVMNRTEHNRLHASGTFKEDPGVLFAE